MCNCCGLLMTPNKGDTNLITLRILNWAVLMELETFVFQRGSYRDARFGSELSFVMYLFCFYGGLEMLYRVSVMLCGVLSLDMPCSHSQYEHFTIRPQ